jgi:PAS domain S-box-containing protein
MTKTHKHQIPDNQFEHEAKELGDIFDANGDLICVSDKDYKITRANHAFSNVLKIEPHDILGKRCYELLHKTQEPPHSCPFRRSIKTKESAFEERYEPTLGLYVEEYTYPLFAVNGELTHCVHVIRDVTKRRLSEDALKESKTQFDYALKATQDGMWNWNIENNDVWYSPRWVQMFGYSDMEIEPNAIAWKRLLHPEDAKRVRKKVYDVLRGNTEFKVEFRLKRKDGRYLDILLRGDAIRRVSGGPIVQIVGTYFDLTEHKRFESEQRRLYQNEMELRQKLESEIQKRINFTNTLVHELKTPLTPVVTCSEMLVRELKEGLPLRLAKNIYHGATDLDQRIDELLELAKIEVGALKIKIQAVDILNLIRKTVDLMTPQAVSNQQIIITHLPKSLPMVKADAGRLNQVLMNLIGNALKYTPAKSEVTVSAQRRENSIIVEVRDNGRGISEELIGSIFEPYFRIKNDGDQIAGLGLGLPIAKSIIELHGGHIWVKSIDGKGSAFRFSLPITGNTGSKKVAGDKYENINH